MAEEPRKQIVIVDTIDITPPKNTAKNVPFETLLELKRKHPKLSVRHLGKLVGISGQAVSSMFMRHGIDWDSGVPAAIEDFKAHRADILAYKQIQTLAALTPAKMQKASARDLAIVAGTLYDKERLERGQSTVNVAALFAKAMEE